jgi:hypothetical protein
MRSRDSQQDAHGGGDDEYALTDASGSQQVIPEGGTDGT